MQEQYFLVPENSRDCYTSAQDIKDSTFWGNLTLIIQTEIRLLTENKLPTKNTSPIKTLIHL